MYLLVNELRIIWRITLIFIYWLLVNSFKLNQSSKNWWFLEALILVCKSAKLRVKLSDDTTVLIIGNFERSSGLCYLTHFYHITHFLQATEAVYTRFHHLNPQTSASKMSSQGSPLLYLDYTGAICQGIK